MKKDVMSKSSCEYIVGRNAVKEAMESDRIIDSIMVTHLNALGSLRIILSKAKEKNITIKQVAKKALDLISSSHQGIIAVAGAKRLCSIEDMLNLAQKKNEPPFLIIADSIEDPQNLGAIIRTAECSGVHGIIIPKRRAAGISSSVEKASAGALEHVLISKVTNLSSTLEFLKSKGLWIYGSDASGETWAHENLTGPLALVVGSEGRGMSLKLKEKCDFMLSIPMYGKINSLNASVAAGVLMYEVCRQRKLI